MAKDIVIQDEYFKTVHMSGVTRLRTDLEGGGECYWVPEDEEMLLIGKSVSANGTYLAMNDDANGYSEVTVNVGNTYGEHDEGRVVSNGTLVDQSSRTITTNGTYDTTTNNSVIVETSSNLSTKTITVNGTYQASSDNVDGYSDVTVSVPNTYTQSDEGKVVSNSALVNQSSRTITTNGTYDTTINNSVTVETSSNLSTKTITVNGTYQASSDNVDGYSDVTVSVPNTYTQSDEGKVVSNSALVNQSSRTISANGTYDTTTFKSVTVSVSGSDIVLGHLEALTNNTNYSAGAYGFAGFDTVHVSVLGNTTSAAFSSNGIYYAHDYGYDGFARVDISVDAQANLSYHTFSENGTYSASDYGYDGFSEITIDVQDTGSVIGVLMDRTIEQFYNSEIQTVGRYAFAGCINLQMVSLQNCFIIESSAFYECNNLSCLYLTNPESCVEIYEDPFANSRVPSIYVHPDLFESYIAAPYWNLYSSYMMRYEEENET